MRWLVEVTSPGTTEKESLVVDAETWHAALQAVRGQRGEGASLVGFALDVHDDGCRAIDPTSHARYDVSRASEPATSTTDEAPPVLLEEEGTANENEPRPRAPSSPGDLMGGRATGRAAPRPSPYAPPGRRSQFPEEGPATTGGYAPAPALAFPEPTPAIPPVDSTPMPTRQMDLSAPADDAAFEILFKREQHRTEAAPVTYREYIFAIASGTSETAAEEFLRGQLRRVQGAIEAFPTGKIVNLAAVDGHVDGKPTGRPLATLSWKDWRGSVVVEFPKRRSSKAPSRPPSQLFSQPPTHPSQPPPPVFPQPTISPPAQATREATIQSEPPPIVEPVARPSMQEASSEPAAPAAVQLQPVVTIENRSVPSPAVSSPAPMVAADPFAVPAPPPSRRPSSSSRNRAVGTRIRTDDLVADLFEAMHEVHFLRDAVEAGDFCLALAMQEIPSQAGLVHLYDINHREFLITSARGTGTAPLLSRRHPETERVLAFAMRRRRPLLMADIAEAAAGSERYNELGGAKSLIVAPVMQAGRFLGAIELLNPLDGQPYTSAEADAIMYISEQLADFVAARGVVTDPERIGARR